MSGSALMHGPRKQPRNTASSIRKFGQSSRVSQEGLKSFICTVSFNSRFIHRFSEYAQTLRNLANTKGAFIWLPSHETAFQNLKSALCTNTLNNFFDKNRQTAIFCDAGKTQHTTNTPGALSSILAQFDTESESWLPIQFASRVLTDCETRYGQTELEALSIRFSCTRFTYYIEGAKNVHIYTDCQALVAMYNKIVKTTPPRILRMILAIQSIDYVVIYLAGKVHIADFLSRNPPKPDPNSIEEGLIKAAELIQNICGGTISKINITKMSDVLSGIRN